VLVSMEKCNKGLLHKIGVYFTHLALKMLKSVQK
jgi:hypothetical protein